MRIGIISCFLVFLLALSAATAPPQGKTESGNMSLAIDNTTFINANRILMFVTNHGNFGRDLGGRFGHDYGTYYPYTSVDAIDAGGALAIRSPLYAAGLWIGAVDSATSETLVVIAEYSDEYVPGPMLGGTFQPDVPEFRAYKLYKDSLKNNPNQDYLDYFAIAVPDQGATIVIDTTWDVDTTVLPWDSTVASIDTLPDMFGADQMVWSVYNDASVAGHNHDAGGTAPLGVEVRQSTFAFNRLDALGEAVFIRWQIVNKGSKNLENTFFSIWSDPDLGSAGDDLVGIDTALSLGFVYNSTNGDQQYGSTPPSLGFDFFQGPLVFTGDPADSAKMWHAWWPGYTNMGAYSFNKYINGTDPDNYAEVYRYMTGLNRDGTPVISPVTGQVTTFVTTGDPVNPGAGEDLDFAAADRRMQISTGPITFRPGDSTEILAAIVVGQGGDRKTSISVLKYNDQFAQTAYDRDFVLPEPPASPVVAVAELDGQITLSWSNDSEIESGDYPFQGYSVYQGPAATGPWTLITNYDIVDGTAQILDLVLDPFTGVLEQRGVKFGSDSGIKRYFVVDQDYLTGSRLFNLTEYYFRVEAYSYSPDPQSIPRTLTSANVDPINVIPQRTIADIELNEIVGDTVGVDHAAGGSGGVVSVEVIDPSALTGHQYEVTFGLDTAVTVVDPPDDSFFTYTTLTDTCAANWDPDGDSLIITYCVDTTLDSIIINAPFNDETEFVFWRLRDVTIDSVLLDNQTNQSGDNDYRVVDGFVVRVAGPAAGFSSFQVIANGNGPVDPPQPGAFAFRDFPTVDNDADGLNDDPGDEQQVGDGLWGIHTGDNGGTSGGGDRGPYSQFLARVLRIADDGGARAARVGSYDFEIRFTGSNSNPGVNGSWAWDAFDNGLGYWVPFEIWRTGIGTPSDASDDLRLIPWILDANNQVFDMSSYGSAGDGSCAPAGCEHSASGGDNDPYTDWIYFRLPDDQTPGDAGYQAFATGMQTDPLNWPGTELPIMDRIVLMNWNGGVLPPFNQDMPEQGTIFRITTAKPNAPVDTFVFIPTAPSAVATNEQALNRIKAVPNPFYMFGPYDPSPGAKEIRFSNLPEKCSISIYNLSGEFVAKVDKDDPSQSYASWNVLTDHGLPVASGIYIYVVDAPGFGQKVGKLAVFTQAEVLLIY